MKNTSPFPENSGGEFFSDGYWRERFLTVVLRAACFLGFAATAVYLLSPSSTLHKVSAAATYGILVLATLFSRLAYGVRAGIFVFLLFFAGFTSLLDYGITDAAILFLGFIVMTGLLFSTRASIYAAIAVTLLVIVIFGGQAASAGGFPRLTVLLLVVSTILGISLHAFQNQFTETQQAARQALNTLRDQRSTLEQRVEERTAGLARITEQLRATARIARKTAEVQDLTSLLNMVTSSISDQFGFYHTGIFLLNENGNQVVLQAASSEGGRRMIERGYALSAETQDIVGYAIAQKKPRIALDTGTAAFTFANPDLPLTRSELAFPLLVRNKVLGVLDIQSDRPQAFNMDDIDVLETLSDQIAIAIENARLLHETQSVIAQLEALTGARTEDAWVQKLRVQEYAFTYTPLGLRAEKKPLSDNNAITAPIVLRGRKIGNISIARKADGKWSRLDEGLLNEVAGQVGLAVDNIRLLEDATQRARQEQTVGKLASSFSQSLDLDTLLQTAARELGELPDVSEVSVFIGQPGEQASPPNPPTKLDAI